jgi:hypothetical protein
VAEFWSLGDFDQAMITFASILVGALVACFFFRIFFDGLTDFLDSLYDLSKVFGLSGGVRNFGFFRIYFYLFLTVGSGFMTYYSLSKYFN